MSSRGESKTASQFVSLTLKLKDKVLSQKVRQLEKIRNTLPTRAKPPDLNLEQEHTVEHKVDCGFVNQEQAVINSLRYFKALVDRLGVDKLVQDQSVVGGLLGGASGGVLEAVQTLVQLDPRLHTSRTISACLTRLYQSVAELIRWVDEVMLQGVAHDNKESKASVTKAIRTVLDGVKELVRLATERQDGSVPLSPVKKQADVEQLEGLNNPLLSSRTSTCQSPEDPSKEEDEQEKIETSTEEPLSLAPPKPPMSFPGSLPQLTAKQEISPPALPPKKRHSLPGTTPCRVAIVAPMRRESEVKLEAQSEDNEHFKRCSTLSAESAAEHTEDDPDYDFLHTDLSSSESLPPFPPPSSHPPALPEKKRGSFAGNSVPQTSTSFGFEPTTHEQSLAHDTDPTTPDELLSSPLSPSKTPPPLPEKKHHIHDYMKFCSTYSGQSPAIFYQPPLTFNQKYSIRQKEVETTYQLTQLDTHLETHLPDSTPSPEQLPAPLLPPKKKQQDLAETNAQYDNHLPSDSPEQEEEQEPSKNSMEQLENMEEVLLTDMEKICQRITMKNEEEEGLDVKAACPDILLVYATETDRNNDQGMYREAFLSTYRSFISPNDVITKLQQRYRHLCERREPSNLTAAKKTFHLLIRVVDELW